MVYVSNDMNFIISLVKPIRQMTEQIIFFLNFKRRYTLSSCACVWHYIIIQMNDRFGTYTSFNTYLQTADLV